MAIVTDVCGLGRSIWKNPSSASTPAPSTDDTAAAELPSTERNIFVMGVDELIVVSLVPPLMTIAPCSVVRLGPPFGVGGLPEILVKGPKIVVAAVMN